MVLQRYTLLAIILLVALTPATIAQKVTPDQVFALGFDADQKGAFEKGEIISTGYKELSDKELALFMAVMVPAPMEKLMDFSRSGESLEANKDLLAHGTLEGDDIKGFLAGVNYEGEEIAEKNKHLTEEPGAE